MKYIKLVLDNLNIKPNSEIKGHVTVNLHAAYSLDLAGYDVAVNLSVFNATNAKYLGYVSDSNGTITGAYVHMGLPTTWSLGLSLGL